ncbi:MAG: hypothetical protein KDJ76_10640 [Xanthobacteraceae bacterium]|nr:hypothetical protein [Xanthobacteraceae bacterium]
MILGTRTTDIGRLRSARGIAAVLVMLLFLCSGAVHACLDIDVANPSGTVTVAASSDADHDSTHPHGLGAEHHCHGCFSVSVPALLGTAAAAAPAFRVASQPRQRMAGRSPGIDTPPPKQIA